MGKLKKLNILMVFILLLGLSNPLLWGKGGFVLAEIDSEEQAQMEAKLKELEDKISTYQAQIKVNQQKSRTLETEIAILDGEINTAELEIQRINLIIANLERKIAEKEAAIREIERQVDLEKAALTVLIRELSLYDDVSFLEIILGRNQLSDFFSELRSLESFQNQIQNALNEIKVMKQTLEQEKLALDEERNEQKILKGVQEEQRTISAVKKQQKKTLLEQTKGQENLFSQLIVKTEKDVEAVRSRLYFLKGIVLDGQLSFGQAYEYAKFASIYTGVRPAFLLAILSRESDLGKNIGTGSWRVDMKPSQRSYYLQICEKLGINPDKYPVSKKAWYGWGGAMGPAQFLPATWLGYESRIAEITGNNPPSPWNVKDAFVAAALYLANKGANQQTYDVEWKAAMIYLAGSRWNKPYLAFYGDQVMSLTAQFQEQIDILEKG